MISKIWNKYKILSPTMKASMWFLICSFVQKGISVVSTPIFTRILSTTDYGKYNVFDSWMSIVSVIISLNLSFGVYVQGLIKFEEDSYRFSSVMQGLNLVLHTFWFFVYLINIRFWNNILSLSTSQIILMFLLMWTSNSFNFWAAEQRVAYKYRMLVALTLLVSIAKPILGVVLVVNSNDKVTARILGIVLVNLIAYSWCSIVQIYRGKSVFSRFYWKYALVYNIPLLPHYLSQIVLNNTDRIMINKMVGSKEAGIYSLAYSIAMLMTLFNTALVQTLNPWIFRKIKDNEVNDIPKVAYMSILIVAFLNILLIMIAPEVVSIFAPKEYMNAIYVIPPVTMGVFFLFSYEIFSKFAFYYEETNRVMIASILGAIMNIILNYVGIKYFGYIAAAYTTLICYVCYSIFHYVAMNSICRRYLNTKSPYNLKILLGITVVFLFTGSLLAFTYNYPVVRYSIVLITVLLSIFNWKKIWNLILRIVEIEG